MDDIYKEIKIDLGILLINIHNPKQIDVVDVNMDSIKRLDVNINKLKNKIKELKYIIKNNEDEIGYLSNDLQFYIEQEAGENI